MGYLKIASKRAYNKDLKSQKSIKKWPSTQKMKRFKMWNSRHFVTKNSIRGIMMGIGPIWRIHSLTFYLRLTQWITRGVDYIRRFHNIKWSTDRCICNGNRAEWSPIRPVILLVIDKRELKHTRFWDEEDGKRKWAVFPYNSSSHNHFYNA